MSITNDELVDDSTILTPQHYILNMVLGCFMVFSIFIAVSIFTYDPADAGWTQSSTVQVTNNFAGPLGALIADTCFFIFGFGAYLVPILFLCKALSIYVTHRKKTQLCFWNISFRIIAILLLIISSCALASLNVDDNANFSSGGLIGSLIVYQSNIYVNVIALTFIMLIVWIIGFTLLTTWSPLLVAEKIGEIVLFTVTFGGSRDQKVLDEMDDTEVDSFEFMRGDQSSNQNSTNGDHNTPSPQKKTNKHYQQHTPIINIDDISIDNENENLHQTILLTNPHDKITNDESTLKVENDTANEFPVIENHSADDFSVNQPNVNNIVPLQPDDKAIQVVDDILELPTVLRINEQKNGNDNQHNLGTNTETIPSTVASQNDVSLQPSITNNDTFDPSRSKSIERNNIEKQSSDLVPSDTNVKKTLSLNEKLALIEQQKRQNHQLNNTQRENVNNTLPPKSAPVNNQMIEKNQAERERIRNELASYGIKLPHHPTLDNPKGNTLNNKAQINSSNKNSFSTKNIIGTVKIDNNSQALFEQVDASTIIMHIQKDENSNEIIPQNIISQPEIVETQGGNLTSHYDEKSDSFESNSPVDNAQNNHTTLSIPDTGNVVSSSIEALPSTSHPIEVMPVKLSETNNELAAIDKTQAVSDSELETSAALINTSAISNASSDPVSSTIKSSNSYTNRFFDNHAHQLFNQNYTINTANVNYTADLTENNTSKQQPNTPESNISSQSSDINHDFNQAIMPNHTTQNEIYDDIDIPSNVNHNFAQSNIAVQNEPNMASVTEEITNPNTQPTKHISELTDDPLFHPLLFRETEKLDIPKEPLPTLDLLFASNIEKVEVDEGILNETALLIENTLADFRIKVTVVGICSGPVITRYELELAPGVKVARITTLDRDLARALSVSAVRVVEVIPGKPYVGLELPNPKRETLVIRDVLDCPAFREMQSPLALVLGKDIGGEPIVANLAKMPHLLVAGTTGSGKSVGVNAMIISILFKASAEDVRFIMIDPKMLELSVYEGIPHLLTPVVTDMKDAANALRWCVAEMERRYKLMSTLGVRNLDGYNEKIKQAEAMERPIPDPHWKPGDTMDVNIPTLTKLPFIVVIVDEFADLIMTEGKKVEELIARLAQKARAAGIHLILATQRPSVEVITGLIKANIPTRIAFTVSSKIDSRTILDQNGAESLLGAGDMLYLPPNSSTTIRVHGAFVADEEVHKVVLNWKARGKPQYIDGITSDEKKLGESSGESVDPVFDAAVQYVIEKQRVSVSGIQRQFKVGFNRASRIVEEMEAQGIVSPPAHNGNRVVLAQ